MLSSCTGVVHVPTHKDVNAHRDGNPCRMDCVQSLYTNDSGVTLLITPRHRSFFSKSVRNIVKAENICSICWEPYMAASDHDLVRLNCQHAFGRKCIIRWAGVKLECPICRKEFFPADLSGGRIGKFRRLANRTIFVADPLEILPLAVTRRLGFCAGIVAGPLCDALCDALFDADLSIETSSVPTVGIIACLSAIRCIVLNDRNDRICNLAISYAIGILFYSAYKGFRGINNAL